jgi:uncharacterized membrane-anchored protein YhcB (DUF1043 family)
MNWYIAICSLVTGIALGLLIARWGDITRLANKQEEFVDVWLRNIDTWNKQFGRLFDINRQILIALIGRKPDLSILADNEDDGGGE